jgi:hypothetical protein
MPSRAFPKYCGNTVISTPVQTGGEIFFSGIRDFSITSFLRNDTVIMQLSTNEASPQSDEAFARDGHSPQGDIYRVLGRRTDL